MYGELYVFDIQKVYFFITSLFQLGLWPNLLGLIIKIYFLQMFIKGVEELGD